MVKKKFDELVRLNRGFDLPDAKIVEGEYPVVASTSIKAYHNEYKVKPPVVVTGRSGSLGTVQYIDKACWPLNTSLYSKDFRDNYPLYVYYFLQTMHLEQFNAGAGVPTLNQNHLQGMRIMVHEREKQESVADFLYLYEKAIENNTKRIKLLEQMAENLYKEWFVRFRFPGHEDAEFEGGMPVWDIKKVEEIGEVIGGGTPSTGVEEYWGGDIPWVSPADLADFTGVYVECGESNITELGLKKSSTKMMPKDTVLLSSRAPIGYVALARNAICTNQGFKSVICNEDIMKHQYLFYFFKMNKSLLESYGSGATFLELSGKSLKRIKLLVPPMTLQKQFSNIVDSIFEEIFMLSNKNNNLIKQRDLLLPRLMSGKIEVK